MSNISKFYFLKFFGRLGLFLLTIVGYILELQGNEIFNKVLYPTVAVIFVIEMIMRMSVPSNLDSMGSQKVFRQNYIPTGNTYKKENRGVLLSAVVWIVVNSILFFIFYKVNLLIQPILFSLCMLYSICDMICVLWFCPFQRWFMGNRCCNTCRIYNWDYLMMFTPLICVPNLLNYLLVFVALVVLLNWEYTYKKFPERFSAESNDNLNCKNCKEKCCRNNKLNKIVSRKFDRLF